jgi:hypothetical protein
VPCPRPRYRNRWAFAFGTHRAARARWHHLTRRRLPWSFGALFTSKHQASSRPLTTARGFGIVFIYCYIGQPQPDSCRWRSSVNTTKLSQGHAERCLSYVGRSYRKRNFQKSVSSRLSEVGTNNAEHVADSFAIHWQFIANCLNARAMTPNPPAYDEGTKILRGSDSLPPIHIHSIT